MKQDKYRKITLLVIILTYIVISLSMWVQDNTKVEDPYYVIGVSQPNLMEPWRIEMNTEIIKAAEKYDYIRIIFKDAGNSTDKQQEDFDELMAYDIDLLIVSMNDSKTLTPLVSKIYEEIPVIVLDRDVLGYDYSLFIGLDNYAIGYEAGKYLSKETVTHNIVEIMGSINSKTSTERSLGFAEAVSEETSLKIVKRISGDWLKDQAEDLFSAFLSETTEVDTVYAHSDDMALGAYLAALEYKIDLEVVGIDGLVGDGRGLELVKDGIINSTFICPTGGKAAIKYAIDILNEVPGIPKKIILRTYHVTKDNVDDYLSGNVKYDQYNEININTFERTIKMGFAQIGSESNWRIANSESIISAAKEEGIDLDFKNVNNEWSDEMKQEQQLIYLNEFIDEDVDIIAFCPIVETGWEEVLIRAKEAGIPIILSDRRVKISTDYYTTYMGSDFVEEGRRAARWLMKNTESSKQVNIVELKGTLGSAPAIGRQEGFAMTINDDDKYKIIASKVAEFKYVDGKLAMEEILNTTNDPIDVVYSHNDDMALGAIEAIEDAGYVAGKDILIISVDATSEALKMIVVGKLNCSIECNPLLGPQMMKAVNDLMSGNELPIEIITGESVYTIENAEADIRSRNY